MSWFSRQLSSMKTSFKGYMLTLDAIPPSFLGFSFNPEKYDDDFSAEFSFHRAPASRRNYPIFSGNSPRIISFTLKFDADYPFSCHIGKSKSEAAGVTNKVNKLKNAIAILETMKLPKAGILSNTIATVAGGFIKGQPSADPSPPLVLLGMSLEKMALGYVSKAKVNVLKYNTKMQPERMTVDVEYLVTPDLILTNVEDVVRTVRALVGSVRTLV